MAEETKAVQNGATHTEVQRRRASIITDMFVRAHISDAYKEKKIRPTVLVVKFYLKDPNPDLTLIQDALYNRVAKYTRFRAIFRKEGNRVFWDSIPKEKLDMKYHFTVMDGLGTYDKASANNYTSSLNSEVWDASKPLWKVTLITNMKEGGSLLLCTIDHAIGDGVALTSVLLSLLDEPKGSLKRLKSLESRRIESPNLRWSHKVTSFLYGCYFGCLGWALVKRDPPSGLKIPDDKCVTQSTGKDSLYTKSFSLSEIKRTKERLAGTSINDMLMAIITVGVRRYYEKTNDPILDLINRRKNSISASFMANVRKVASFDKEIEEMGNNFITGYFILPLLFKNAIDAVWQCKSYADSLKVSPAFALQFHVAGGICKLLPENALVFASVDNPKNFTLVLSSVKGPQYEASIAGYEIDDLNYAGVANCGLNLGFVSYNGKAKINVTADKLVGMNCPLFVECLEDAYDEIRDAVENASAEELEPPNLTPLSAKLLEGAVAFGIVGAVAFLSMWLAK